MQSVERVTKNYRVSTYFTDLRFSSDDCTWYTRTKRIATSACTLCIYRVRYSVFACICFSRGSRCKYYGPPCLHDVAYTSTRSIMRKARFEPNEYVIVAVVRPSQWRRQTRSLYRATRLQSLSWCYVRTYAFSFLRSFKLIAGGTFKRFRRPTCVKNHWLDGDNETLERGEKTCCPNDNSITRIRGG